MKTPDKMFVAVYGTSLAILACAWVAGSLAAQTPVEGRKHDKNKHVAPEPPVDPTPAPKPVRPHIEPVPDEHFIDVVDGKHPKPDKHKVVVPDPKPAPAPHVEPVKPVARPWFIPRLLLLSMVVAGIVIASRVQKRWK